MVDDLVTAAVSMTAESEETKKKAIIIVVDISLVRVGLMIIQVEIE